MSRQEAIEKLEDIIRITNTKPHTVTDKVINNLANQSLAALQAQPKCKKCGGSGVVRRKCPRPVECSKCDGWGWLPIDPGREYQDSCPECGLEPCPDCQPAPAGEKPTTKVLSEGLQAIAQQELQLAFSTLPVEPVQKTLKLSAARLDQQAKTIAALTQARTGQAKRIEELEAEVKELKDSFEIIETMYDALKPVNKQLQADLAAAKEEKEIGRLKEEASFVYQFNQLAEKIYKWACKTGHWEAGKDRNDGEMITFMHSELSEAWEALRDGNPPDKHCPEFSGAAIELADCIIRIMDTAHARKWKVAEAILAKMEFNKSRPYKHGRMI